MRTLIFAAACALAAMTGGANAASLCNCCESGTEASCAAVCAPVKPAPGQCVATVDFAGTPVIAEGVNPLYSVPLRNLWIGSPNRNQLEDFRRLLELARKGVEKDRKMALKQRRQGKIDAAAAAAAAKRYDEAIVNYYLGLRSYRDAFDGS